MSTLPPQISGDTLYTLHINIPAIKLTQPKHNNNTLQSQIQWWGSNTYDILPHTYNIVIPVDKFVQYCSDIPKQSININITTSNNDIIGTTSFTLKHFIDYINNYQLNGNKELIQYQYHTECSILSSSDHKYIGSCTIHMSYNDISIPHIDTNDKSDKLSSLLDITDTHDSSLLKSPQPQTIPIQATPQTNKSMKSPTISSPVIKSPVITKSSAPRSIIDELLNRAMKLQSDVKHAANDTQIVKSNNNKYTTPAANKITRHSESYISPSIISPLLCFTIISNDKELHIQTPTHEARDEIVEALMYAKSHVNELQV